VEAHVAKAHTLSGLIRFIGRTQWEGAFAERFLDHVGQACDAFDVEVEDLGDILGDVLSSTLRGCVLEDLMTVDYEEDGNVVDAYLERRGYAESGGTKRYMQALRGAVMSLYEVSDVVPGKSFLARDLIRGGEPVRVLEVSGTKTLKAWDRFAARLLRLGSEWRMAGGILLFDRETSEQVIEVLGELAEGGNVADAPEILAHAAPAFTAVWLADALDRVLNPRMPTLQNSDGHPIVMCTSSFAMQAGVTTAACRAALSTVQGLQGESDSFFNWLGAPCAPSSRARPAESGAATTLVSFRDSGETVLGSIEIEEATVVLSTNSRERADLGEAMIGDALRELVGKPAREERTVEEMLADKRAGVGDTEASPQVPPEIAKVVIHEHLDRHYRDTLDQPIPALGNVSPREAVRSAPGRAKVVDWLKYMENHAAKTGGGADPIASYDFRWIWRELGVADRRA
jgi:hypothetical protein